MGNGVEVLPEVLVELTGVATRTSAALLAITTAGSGRKWVREQKFGQFGCAPTHITHAGCVSKPITVTA